jgi:hypothetical protein
MTGQGVVQRAQRPLFIIKQQFMHITTVYQSSSQSSALLKN